ncbi:MAG: hypothetical protein ACLGGY_01635 [Gammaproteobacteria bacterium]
MNKLVIGALLLLIGYFGFDYVVAARLGYLSLDCATPSDHEKISKESKLSINEQLKISSKIFTCIREKQSPVERLIIKVPENWINPPAVSQ